MAAESLNQGGKKEIIYRRDEDGAIVAVPARWEDPRIQPEAPSDEKVLDGDALHVEMTLLG